MDFSNDITLTLYSFVAERKSTFSPRDSFQSIIFQYGGSGNWGWADSAFSLPIVPSTESFPATFLY